MEKVGHWWGTPVPLADVWWRPRGLLTPCHPPLYSALCAAVVLFLAWGPVVRWPSTPEEWLWKLSPLLIALGLLVGGNRAAHSSRYCRDSLPVYQALVLGLLVLFVLLVGWKGSAVEGGLYAHVGLLLFVVLVVALVLDWALACRLFSSPPGQFKTQLLVWAAMERRRGRKYDQDDKEGTSFWWRLVPGSLAEFVTHPLLLLLPAAFALLLVPSENGLWWLLEPLSWLLSLLSVGDTWIERVFGGRRGLCLVGAATLAATWFVLACLLGLRGGRHFLGAAHNLLMTGPPAAVSLTVIAVAILRLAENNYIDYLFAIAPRGTNCTLVFYTLSAYVLFWFYGYWSARYEVVHFLHALNSPDAAALQVSSYGLGRLNIRIGVTNKNADVPQPTGKSQVPQPVDLKAHPTPIKLVQELVVTSATSDCAISQLPKLRARLGNCYLYATLRNVVPVLIAILLYWFFSSSPQRAEMTVQPDPTGPRFDLVSALSGKVTAETCPPAKLETPRIALAASGGGTRAAIYTASVLQGLAEANQICNLVLASGVSGGSVALAYLARHHAELMQSANAPGDAWVRYSEEMAYPFIQDVLEGVSELRMVVGELSGGAESWFIGVRNGDLLAESIERRFGDTGTTFEGIPFGLLLNSSLAGAAPRWRWGGAAMPSLDSESLTTFLANFDEVACGGTPPTSLAEREDACSDMTTNEAAGGRLVFTNLLWPEVGHARSSAPLPMAMIVLDEPRISVSRASALSANFPPVFSNAAVDVEAADKRPARRYWVTDGGAVENRATLAMLMALDGAVAQLAASAEERARAWREPPPELPLLHVIVAEASAPGGRFNQDRGVGASLGAGSQLGRAIERLYMERLEERYAKAGQSERLFFHELAMPNALRTEGIGTHWMLPASVHLRCPPGIPRKADGSSGCGEWEEVTLERDQVVKLIGGLHSNSCERDHLSERAEPVRDLWIAQDLVDNHPNAWQRLLSCLRGDKNGCTPGSTPVSRPSVCPGGSGA